MIAKKDNYFVLSTSNTSFVLGLNDVNKLCSYYYGQKIDAEKFDKTNFCGNQPFPLATSVSYDPNDEKSTCLDHENLELRTLGKGDYHLPSMILKNKRTNIFDFGYHSYNIRKPEDNSTFPTPEGAEEELIIVLKEATFEVYIKMHYLVFKDTDVIGRYIEIENKEPFDLVVKRAMSLNFARENYNDSVLYTTGTWANEGNLCRTKLQPGRFSFGSSMGVSSNRHNPFFLVVENDANNESGTVMGFNLVYSGSFETNFELDPYGKLNIQQGIDCVDFEKYIKTNEKFVSPISVMTITNKGINGVSENFQNFINNSITPRQFRNIKRPIAYNNWEATAWKFNRRKINRLMKIASSIGIELFVLDDGWFGNRSDDTKGLGDWFPNKSKLRGDIESLVKQANKNGLKFGLWMEPEMVNENSELFKLHPDWIIHDIYHRPSKGRHQFVLDLRREDVQKFIVEAVANVLNSGDVKYLKWDMNRPLSDYNNDSSSTGEFVYDYYVGLYKVFSQITSQFPNVIIENCCSGGNRYDLGMLRYCPYSWLSDNTDSFERLKMQATFSLAYPVSTMSNHVGAKRSNQMLRDTLIDDKFNVACFGVLGYELDLNDLSQLDKRIIREQIKFYKERRDLFQYGTFSTQEKLEINRNGKYQLKLGDEAVVGHYRFLVSLTPEEGRLKVNGFDKDDNVSYSVRRHRYNANTFGHLINFATYPIHVNPQSNLMNTINNHIAIPAEKFSGVSTGAILGSDGIKLSDEWKCNGINPNIRIIRDFSSRLYYFKVID